MTDTLKVSVISASLKETTVEERTLNMSTLERNHITSAKDASFIIPNFYQPDYGSHTTSSIYIRGLGSRMDQPAMGLYIDDIPVMNKSSYDTDFLDIRSMKLLKGPQGTLYGRNSHSGAMIIRTLAPEDRQGLSISVEFSPAMNEQAAYGGSFKTSASYGKVLKNGRGISATAWASHYGGDFINEYDGSVCDISDSYGFRSRYGIVRSDTFTLESILSAGIVREGGYAYKRIDEDGTVLPVNYNDPSRYDRTTLTEGLIARGATDKHRWSAVASYQFLDDNMRLDNDFTPLSLFEMTQAQREHAFTFEFLIRRRDSAIAPENSRRRRSGDAEEGARFGGAASSAGRSSGIGSSTVSGDAEEGARFGGAASSAGRSSGIGSSTVSGDAEEGASRRGVSFGDSAGGDAGKARLKGQAATSDAGKARLKGQANSFGGGRLKGQAGGAGAADRQWGWEPLTGVFAFTRLLDISAPVLFKRDGIDQLILANANNGIHTMFPDASLEILEDQFLLTSDFFLPSYGAALFHSSEFTTGRWKFTAGVRLNAEGAYMRYASEGAMNYRFSLTMNDFKPLKSVFEGNSSQFSLTVSPAIEASYTLPEGLIRASVRHGFKAGGFNTQIFSDILQNIMMNDMMSGLGLHLADGPVSDASSTEYKPESAWSHEISARWHPGRHFQIDATAFYMRCKDLQVTVMPKGNGTGRLMSNAGKSVSAGIELSSTVTSGGFSLSADYGLTEARFLDYQYDESTNYAGKRVPFAPEHTVSAVIAYGKALHKGPVSRIDCSLSLRGAGAIWWDHENTLRQPFYCTAGADVSARCGRATVSLWGKNLTNTVYDTFCFSSVSRTFVSQGRPVRIGVSLKLDL